MKRRDLERLVDEEAAARKPFVSVALRGRRGQVRGKALVDTGAAHSFIDTEVAQKLALEHVGRAQVHGIAGGKKPITLDKYAVRVSFPGTDLHDVTLSKGAFAKSGMSIRNPGRVAIIGRDAMAGGDRVTHGMRVSYDGPSGKLELRRSRRSKRR